MSQRYRNISGADLAQGLKTARVTPTQFAALYDIPPKRVVKWINGEAPVPHSVAMFVGLIADPTILEKALVIARYMIDESAIAAAREPGARRSAKADDAEPSAA